MSARPIIDAGPALNFLSINKERILFGVLGPISTPETVETEILRKDDGQALVSPHRRSTASTGGAAKAS